MGEKDTEAAQKAKKVKEVLDSKEVEELLKKSEEVLWAKPTTAKQQLSSEVESKETIEKLKRKRQRIEQAF